jgi:glycogen debranching enzyme
MLFQFDQRERARSFEARAEAVRQGVDARLVVEELGAYVLALDGAKRPCRVRSSNAGHVLLTDLAYAERSRTIVRTLMQASSFGGWGIRTIPSTEVRYNPMSYHNGSVWPHDNALIAAGMARYRYREDVARIFEGLFAASTYIDLRRLPELFCGFPRQRAQGPTFYPVACSPQAWAAAAPLSLLQSCLGLIFKPSRNEIRFKEPYLPSFLDEVLLKGLCLNGRSADIAIRRSRENVVIDVLERHGDLRVVTVA